MFSISNNNNKNGGSGNQNEIAVYLNLVYFWIIFFLQKTY